MLLFTPEVGVYNIKKRKKESIHVSKKVFTRPQKKEKKTETKKEQELKSMPAWFITFLSFFFNFLDGSVLSVHTFLKSLFFAFINSHFGKNSKL